MRIWFIRHETDYGPFFSTREKAIEWLKQDEENDNLPQHLAEILAGDDPYTSLMEVELDTETYFDG